MNPENNFLFKAIVYLKQHQSNVFHFNYENICEPKSSRCLCIIIFIIFTGFCTEYNTYGAVIQPHYRLKCSNVDPPCVDRYISTDAYLCKLNKNNMRTFKYYRDVFESVFMVLKYTINRS